MTPPNRDEAIAFAIMLNAGMPALEAVRYFFLDEIEDTKELMRLEAAWLKSKVVQDAMLTLQGKAWQELTLTEQIDLALNLHYKQLAFLLYSRHYADLVGADRQKADIARQVLEAKQAGMSGKVNALERWFADIQAGRVSLGLPA